MDITDSQRKKLKGLAHSLNPIIMVGQHGLKATLLTALEEALEYHQLVKVKISVGDRDARDEILKQLLQHASEATLIQRIGNTAILYQRNPKRPNLLDSTE